LQKRKFREPAPFHAVEFSQWSLTKKDEFRIYSAMLNLFGDEITHNAQRRTHNEKR